MDKSIREPRGNEQQQAERGKETSGTANKDVQISLPKTERPEGPFEHSGETSGWTKAEESEKGDKEQQ